MVSEKGRQFLSTYSNTPSQSIQYNIVPSFELQQAGYQNKVPHISYHLSNSNRVDSSSSCTDTVINSKKYRKEFDEVLLPKQITDLEHELRHLRTQLANKYGVNPYSILSSEDLSTLSKSYPVSVDQLKSVNGWGDAKVEKFGNIFIEKIIQYLQSHQLQVMPSPLYFPDVWETVDTG